MRGQKHKLSPHYHDEESKQPPLDQKARKRYPKNPKIYQEQENPEIPDTFGGEKELTRWSRTQIVDLPRTKWNPHFTQQHPNLPLSAKLKTFRIDRKRWGVGLVFIDEGVDVEEECTKSGGNSQGAGVEKFEWNSAQMRVKFGWICRVYWRCTELSFFLMKKTWVILLCRASAGDGVSLSVTCLTVPSYSTCCFNCSMNCFFFLLFNFG